MTGVTLLAQGLPPDRQTDIETQNYYNATLVKIEYYRVSIDGKTLICFDSFFFLSVNGKITSVDNPEKLTSSDIHIHNWYLYDKASEKTFVNFMKGLNF